ncbi:hypothetical protein [Fusibacter sp. 3D3]|uniref:hypothetical protein n=1 Tax=Fusibacter sp. 3D3 TaxID=1048380 RepID=UPI000852D5B5|nr:hypothetical protein [Fusibacter sp. 3D3]GAU77864.1 hypothetical protein F3D3_2493 [Fusibacter sp. 3D3]
MKITYNIVRAQVFINQKIWRQKEAQKERWVKDIRGEFGMNSIIGVAIGLIIAAFVLIPSLKTFATTVMTSMTTWWTGTINGTLFPTK